MSRGTWGCQGVFKKILTRSRERERECVCVCVCVCVHACVRAYINFGGFFFFLGGGGVG